MHGGRCSFWSSEGLKALAEKAKGIEETIKMIREGIEVVSEMIEDMNSIDTIKQQKEIETPPKKGEGEYEGIKDLNKVDELDVVSAVNDINTGKDLKRKGV